MRSQAAIGVPGPGALLNRARESAVATMAWAVAVAPLLLRVRATKGEGCAIHTKDRLGPRSRLMCDCHIRILPYRPPAAPVWSCVPRVGGRPQPQCRPHGRSITHTPTTPLTPRLPLGKPKGRHIWPRAQIGPIVSLATCRWPLWSIRRPWLCPTGTNHLSSPLAERREQEQPAFAARPPPLMLRSQPLHAHTTHAAANK